MLRVPKASRELDSALQDDWKRQAVDAAKKRAVAQHVDYDTFRNMVLTAHLKPIQAPSAPKHGPMLPAWQLDPEAAAAAAAAGRASQSAQQTGDALAAAASKISGRAQYNSPQQPASGGSAAGSSSQYASAPPQQGTASSSSLPPRPATAADFARAWRRSCTAQQQRWGYLQSVGAAQLPDLFKVEVSGELLGEIIAVLTEGWRQAKAAGSDAGCAAAAHFILDTLQALTGCGRFALAARLLSRERRAALAGMLAAISGAGHNSECAAMLADLQAAYGC